MRRTHETGHARGRGLHRDRGAGRASARRPRRCTSRRPRCRAGSQNLEDLLGVKLVERTTRSVALTRIGANFLPQARRLLGDLTAALVEIRETGEAQRGDVIDRLRAHGRRAVPAAHHPGSTRRATRATGSRSSTTPRPAWPTPCCVARRSSASTSPGRTIPSSRACRCSQDRFVLICRDDHPLAKRTRLAWKQLEPHPLIFAGAGQRQSAAAGRPRSTRRRLRCDAHYEVQRSSTAVGLVAAGRGARPWSRAWRCRRAPTRGSASSRW